MKITKEKALSIRENADRLLKKMEAEEQNEYKKLALSFSGLRSDIGRILSVISKPQEKQKDIDLSPLLRALQSLEKSQTSTKVDLSPLIAEFRALHSLLGKKAPEMVFPVEKIASSLKTKDRTDEVIQAIKEIKVEVPAVKFPDSISVDNFPPQKIPQPVTNININPLRGSFLNTAVSVGTSATALPSSALSNRRSVIIYNNSSTTTLYVGGSGVTASNGLPVPANSFSPSFDAGPNMTLYGVSDSGTINIRVLEMSNESIGG